MNQLLLTNSLTSTINSIFSGFFSSIDEKIYSLLDDIVFINSTDFLTSESKYLLGTTEKPGIILICNALLLGFMLYYACSFFLSHLTLSQTQSPTQFVFKLIICVIVVNSSLYICYLGILFSSYLSILIRSAGEYVLGVKISFSDFLERINTIFPPTSMDFNFFSFDGLIRSLISFGFINLTISYSLRFVMIKVFTLICPFAILCLSIDKFSWIFKSWIKIYFSLLFQQVFISFVLVIAFSLDIYDYGQIKSLLYIGTIYALIKSNSLMKDFMGGLSTDASLNVSSFQSLLKK